MKRFLITAIFLFAFGGSLIAQSVSLTPSGVELPTLTNAQIIAINNPKTGAMVFDNTYKVVRVYDGTSWVCSSCTEPSFSTVQKVLVKSFDYNSTGCTYTNLRDFKAADDGLGDVKTVYTGSTPNGFLLDNHEVIVFDNPLSTLLQSLSAQELIRMVQNSSWTNPYLYIQACDIAVRSDHTNLLYNIREAGNTERREGSIMGLKAYRFTNRIFLEKYNSSSITTLMSSLIKNATSFNLLGAMNITNPDSYHIISTSPYFVVTNGILTFYRPTSGKPQNNFGIIYFLPKSNNLPLMRMRVFTHRPSQATINTYFDTNGNVFNLTNYVNNYFENVVNSPNSIPFVLHIPQGTNNLRVADDNRVPPPTAGTEDTL